MALLAIHCIFCGKYTSSAAPHSQLELHIINKEVSNKGVKIILKIHLK
jgi:hypothetical protein